MTDWQPIETASKPGFPVWLQAPDLGFGVRFYIGWWRGEHLMVLYEREVEPWDQVFSEVDQPTHWKPITLPEKAHD